MRVNYAPSARLELPWRASNPTLLQDSNSIARPRLMTQGTPYRTESNDRNHWNIFFSQLAKAA